MSTNRSIPLMNELAVFAKVVESGSFSEAARQLGLTPSAVSRSIARLEKALGMRLLLRTTRKLRLSEGGSDVYRHCEAMMHSAAAALDVPEQSGAEPAGTIRVSAPRALGRWLLHPCIPAYLARYPQVNVVLRLEDRQIDLIDEHMDLVFRVTDEPPPGLQGRRLVRIDHVVCATPTYLLRYGTPMHPRELKRHSCIALSEDVADTRWTFTGNGKRVRVDASGRYTANHAGVRLDAVLHDLGIGAVPYFIAREALQHGLVVPVLPDWQFTTSHCGDAWALYPPTRHLPARTRCFIDFVADQLATSAGHLPLPNPRPVHP